MIRIDEQAQMLIDDIGTDREWIAIGNLDEDGLSEVVALAHNDNAAFIVKAVNCHDELVEALEFYARNIIRKTSTGEFYVMTAIEHDCGDRARAALAKAKGE